MGYSPRPVQLVPHENNSNWRRTVGTHWFSSGHLPTKHPFPIEEGFRFNGFSRPWWTHWLFGDPYGRHAGSGLGHDYLYRRQQARGLPVTRLQADRAMREWMKLEGAGRIKRELAYAAVRATGGDVWRKYREALS